MKKNVLAMSALALAMFSGSVMADTNMGEVQFVGVVSDTTCDIVPSVGGAENAVIQLGSVKTSVAGNVVEFALKPVAGSSCDLTGLTNANFNFTSSSMNEVGIGNDTGLATDANMLLKVLNAGSGSTVVDIKNGSTTAAVPVTELNDQTKGAKLSAQLVGGAVAGDYKSAVVYAVSYN